LGFWVWVWVGCWGRVRVRGRFWGRGN
jgi:hypothetical protein